MAQIPDSVRVTGLIAPSDDTDNYPSHHAKWGKGGLRSVADLTERNNISTDRREEGMVVFVQSSSLMYQLVGGITNGDWIAFSPSGGEWQDIGAAPNDFLAPTDGANKKVSVGTVTNPPTAAAGTDPGAFFRVEQGHIEVKGTGAGDWDGPHLVLGTYHFWIDSSSRLRMKNGAPSSDTDGNIIGMQS